MSLPIITADQRLAEPRGIKGCIFGKSGIGKTSLLWSLTATTTLFMDLEAGDLAIEGWQGDTIRPRTWMDCRDFAVFIGGPNPSLRDDQAYSPAHHAAVCHLSALVCDVRYAAHRRLQLLVPTSRKLAETPALSLRSHCDPMHRHWMLPDKRTSLPSSF